jgi:chromosome segregation ATPase
MKLFLCIGFVFLFTTQLHAETYSWIDDSGTYNFTEDYASIPKKYRKKVKRRDDVPQETAPQAAANSEKPVRQAEKADGKTAEVAGGEKELYGGKSRAAWRKELDAQEEELSSLEQRIKQLREQLLDTKGVPSAQFDELKKNYKDSRTSYDQKYKSYSELIETVRKAGFTVEIKK